MDSNQIWELIESACAPLRAEIAALRQRLDRLEGVEIATPPPAPTAPAAPPAPAPAQRPAAVSLSRHQNELFLAAPLELRAQIKPTLEALCSLPDNEERPRTQAQLVVELVELCEESRRSADLTLPFYESLEDRLQQLVSEAGLEPIQPHRGDPYRIQEHMILKSVRGDGSRDSVERCLKRGFRFQGHLLKKAEVSVFL